MSLIIRRMRQSDMATLAMLRHQTFFRDGKLSLEADIAGLGSLLDVDGFEAGFVAEADENVVGSCLFVRMEIEPLHDLSPWLAGLVVAEPFRGQGIGRRLVEAVERHAASVGCRTLHLYTEAAEQLYAGMGWTVAERLDVDGEPLVLMKREL